MQQGMGGKKDNSMRVGEKSIWWKKKKRESTRIKAMMWKKSWQFNELSTKNFKGSKTNQPESRIMEMFRNETVTKYLMLFQGYQIQTTLLNKSINGVQCCFTFTHLQSFLSPKINLHLNLSGLSFPSKYSLASIISDAKKTAIMLNFSSSLDTAVPLSLYNIW